MFNWHIHYKWWLSIVMLVITRGYPYWILITINHYKSSIHPSLYHYNPLEITMKIIFQSPPSRYPLVILHSYWTWWFLMGNITINGEADISWLLPTPPAGHCRGSMWEPPPPPFPRSPRCACARANVAGSGCHPGRLGWAKWTYIIICCICVSYIHN